MRRMPRTCSASPRYTGPGKPAGAASGARARPSGTKPACSTGWRTPAKRCKPTPGNPPAPPVSSPCTLSRVKSWPPTSAIAWCTTCSCPGWSGCTNPCSSTTATPTAKARAHTPQCSACKPSRAASAAGTTCNWTLPTSSTAWTGAPCMGCCKRVCSATCGRVHSLRVRVCRAPSRPRPLLRRQAPFPA